MGMAWLGVTHCSKHYTPLEEFGRCKECEEEKEKEKQEQIKQILNFFNSLNEYELEGLKELASEKGKEIEERKLKEEIENLKYKIEKMKSEANK